MLTIAEFENKINITNGPGWLSISVDEALLDKLVEVTKVPLRLWKDIVEYKNYEQN